MERGSKMTNKGLARVLALLAQREKEERQARNRLLVLIPGYFSVAAGCAGFICDHKPNHVVYGLGIRE